MGLTVQNLGVEATRVLGVPPEKRDDPIAVPSMAGWTWLTLREIRDEEELEALAVVAATVSGARALAYSVDDSDSAYIVGATSAGPAFRLNVHAENDAVEIERAARFAAVPVAPIEEALTVSYVFAEDGVRALHAAMGLLAPSAHAPPTIDAGKDDDEEDEDDAAFVSAIRRNREGRRWVATAELPFAGRWVVIAAEGHPSGELAASFCARRDRIAIVGASRDIDELRSELTQVGTGVVLGAWHEIPEDIPRSLSATIGWALDTVR